MSMIDDGCQTVIHEPLPDNTCRLPMLSDLHAIGSLSNESIQPYRSSNQSKHIQTMYRVCHHCSYAFWY